MAYERVMRPGRCYQVIYGPRFVLVQVLTGIAWDQPHYTQTVIIPNEDLRPAAEWQAHQERQS